SRATRETIGRRRASIWWSCTALSGTMTPGWWLHAANWPTRCSDSNGSAFGGLSTVQQVGALTRLVNAAYGFGQGGLRVRRGVLRQLAAVQQHLHAELTADADQLHMVLMINPHPIHTGRCHAGVLSGPNG